MPPTRTRYLRVKLNDSNHQNQDCYNGNQQPEISTSTKNENQYLTSNASISSSDELPDTNNHCYNSNFVLPTNENEYSNDISGNVELSDYIKMESIDGTDNSEDIVLESEEDDQSSFTNGNLVEGGLDDIFHKKVLVENGLHDNLNISSKNVGNDNGKKIFTSNNLQKTYYSTENDVIELKNLLSCWGIPELFDYFESQQLYVGILKHMPQQMITKIFKNTNFSLGVQAEFCYQWSQWVQKTEGNLSNKNLNLPEPAAILRKEYPVKLNYLRKQHPNDLQGDANSKLQNFGGLNLTNILSTGPYGPVVTTYYKQHNSLDESTRKILLEAFLHYSITTGCVVSKAACRSIATDIQKVFKGEVAEYYYIHRPKGVPLGKLYNKFHNWKSKTNINKNKNA